MQVSVQVSNNATSDPSIAAPFPLTMTVVVYEGSNASLSLASWVTDFTGITSKTAVLYYDSTNSGLLPGLYINEGGWKLALPYQPYLSNFVINGGSATIYHNPTQSYPVPESSFVFENGKVIAPPKDIPPGNNLWAVLVISLALVPATTTTLGGVVVQSGLSIDTSGNLSVDTNTAVDIDVTSGSSVTLTEDQASKRVFRIKGAIDTADAIVYVPSDKTGLFYVENKTTSKGGKSVWFQYANSNPARLFLAGQSGFMYGSLNSQGENYLEHLTLIEPATKSTLGGVIVGANINVAADGTISVAAPTPEYVLPKATSTVLGGVTVPSKESGLSVSDGAVSIKTGIGLSIDGSNTLQANIASVDQIGMVFALASSGIQINGSNGQMSLSLGSGITLGGNGVITADVQKVAGVSPVSGNVPLAVGNITGAAPLASPEFTGTPKVPTASATDDSEQIANTDFVGLKLLQIGTRNWMHYSWTLDQSEIQNRVLHWTGDDSGSPVATFPTDTGRWLIINDSSMDISCKTSKQTSGPMVTVKSGTHLDVYAIPTTDATKQSMFPVVATTQSRVGQLYHASFDVRSTPAVLGGGDSLSSYDFAGFHAIPSYLKVKFAKGLPGSSAVSILSGSVGYNKYFLYTGQGQASTPQAVGVINSGYNSVFWDFSGVSEFTVGGNPFASNCDYIWLNTDSNCPFAAFDLVGEIIEDNWKY